jgi:hypothetical protein
MSTANTALDRIRVNPAAPARAPIETPPARAARAAARDAEFLKGPILLTHIRRACKVSATSYTPVGLYLAIRHQAALKKQDWVPVSQSLMAKFGLSRFDKCRWLPRLAAAGLIAIRNQGHRTTLVRLLPVPDDDESDDASI